jgi:DNA-binding response OmpR family regulator
MSAQRVLLVEDDARLATMVSDYLGEAGFRTTRAGTGAAAMQLVASETFDALILDLMLPDADGLDLCRSLRARSDIPILMLTARGDPLDRVVGLELARLRAILRRRVAPGAERVLRFGRLEIDRDAREVRVDAQRRNITAHQFALLLALAERAGRVLSRDALMELTKGAELEDFDRSIDVHISRLRAAIEDDPRRPRRILTLRGAGYVFAKEQDVR